MVEKFLASRGHWRDNMRCHDLHAHEQHKRQIVYSFLFVVILQRLSQNFTALRLTPSLGKFPHNI